MNFFRTSEPERLARVFTYKSGAMFRAGTSISIPCKLQSCVVDQTTAVVSEPSIDLARDEGLQIRGSILIFRDSQKWNFSGYQGPRKTWLGDVHLVWSMTPLEVSFKEC